MRKIKRLAAAILTAALALSLIVVPASAAPGSFSDVSDKNTAVNADILRLMGVVSGTGGNMFKPYDTLTRAQFCVMMVNFLQKGEETPRYATRTIFSDVRGGHWARSYINLAATYCPIKEGEKEIPLISGVGDGRFMPDDEITLAEAATILLRALKYTSEQAGAVWPQGYMDLAKSIGLTEGVSAGTYENISRGQAAQLFVNALKCKTAEGKVYYETIGSKVEKKTIVLAVGVSTDDGSSTGAIRTTSSKNSEAYLPAHGDGNPTSLQGKRGDLVLDENEEIITFVPDDSTAITITLNGDAQAAYVKGSNGQQYTISADATVFTGTGGEGKGWLDSYKSLPSGTQITMYSEKGKITAIYSTTSTTTIDSDAVVIMDHATTATFHALTGGVTNFNIVKDRQSIRLNQIKPYDVVTYDQISNTLVVSDLRMTAVYTDPQPSPKTPTKLRLISGGQEIDVLQSAWDTIGDIKPGDSVSLLLTADGKVAGIVKPTPQARSTAIGVIEGGSVSIYLPNGSTMSLGKVSNASGIQNGQPVIVSAARDSFTVSRLPDKRAPGSFDLNKLKLGDLTVSSSVRIYEQVQGGNVTAVSRGDLAMETIPVDQIASYHVNSANIVDYIILTNVTGSAYIYGMMVGGYVVVEEATPGTDAWTDKDGKEHEAVPPTPEKTRYGWYLRSGTQEIEFSSATSYRGSSGDMVGVVVGKDRKGSNTIKEVVKLTAVKAEGSDFFESQGETYVTVKGQTYRISSGVECYYNRTGNKVAKENWLTDANRLDAIQTYSDSFTLYVDPIGQQVRIIVAN